MMVFIRKKVRDKKIYYYIVENKRNEQGKVKQKVLFYLGTIDNIIKMLKFWKKHN